MGVNPIRFLIVPRLAALTVVGPALTLMSAFIGIAGGFVVSALMQGTTPGAFWDRILFEVEIGDWQQCLIKSLGFAWIIGFTGSLLGLRAGHDAGSVGRATTRTVVVSVFFIIVFDAVFATIVSVEGWT
jgi:phospholipid/cholesterol/gamma-HCH transport system permease protein